jgi:hypothetical protein
MADDDVLKDLSGIVREEDLAADPRWRKLAEGTLSAEDEAALRELARASPEARRLYETYRPLGDDFRNGTTAVVAAEASAGRAEHATNGHARTDEGDDGPRDPRPPSGRR